MRQAKVVKKNGGKYDVKDFNGITNQGCLNYTGFGLEPNDVVIIDETIIKKEEVSIIIGVTSSKSYKRILEAVKWVEKQ